MFQAYVSSVSFVFIRMFQVFHLDVLKVDLGEHMLQWSRWLVDNGRPQPSATYYYWGTAVGHRDASVARIHRRGTWIPACAHETEEAWEGPARARETCEFGVAPACGRAESLSGTESEWTEHAARSICAGICPDVLALALLES